MSSSSTVPWVWMQVRPRFRSAPLAGVVSSWTQRVRDNRFELVQCNSARLRDGECPQSAPADCLTCFFAGDIEFQQARALNSVLEEAFEESAVSVKQNALGMLRLELDVMTQHRCDHALIHLAVVRLGGSVAVVNAWVVEVFAWIRRHDIYCHLQALLLWL